MERDIVIDKNVRHGKPVVKGTRVTIEEILGALTGGMTYDEIEKEYGIDHDGIRAAVRYAAAWLQGEEVISFEESSAGK